MKVCLRQKNEHLDRSGSIRYNHIYGWKRLSLNSFLFNKNILCSITVLRDFTLIYNSLQRIIICHLKQYNRVLINDSHWIEIINWNHWVFSMIKEHLKLYNWVKIICIRLEYVLLYIFAKQTRNKFATLVEDDQKASFSIATIPSIHTLYCWVLRKEISSTILKVFGMTRPGIEPRSSGSLSNTLPTGVDCNSLILNLKVNRQIDMP